VVDHEDFDTKMRRLGRSTEGLVPPRELVHRWMTLAQAPPAASWVDAIVHHARWALVPAVAASALLAAATWSDEGDIEEAVYLGTTTGLLP